MQPDTDRLVPLNAPTRIGLERCVRSLRCSLTPSERLSKSQVLADQLNELETLEAKHKALKAEMRELEAAAVRIVRDLGYDVRTGTELRDTECEFVADFELDRHELVRLDTGDVIMSEKLPDAKRQLALKIVDR